MTSLLCLRCQFPRGHSPILTRHFFPVSTQSESRRNHGEGQAEFCNDVITLEDYLDNSPLDSIFSIGKKFFESPFVVSSAVVVV